jgi:phosphatidylserine/phosphatidylglycerophosphate/cardiolipin synthase-like enzyme
VEEMANADVRITRVRHPEDLPMHAKFLLVDHSGQSSAWLGSYNFNKRSRRKNAEVLLRTTDKDVIQTLSKRFAQIAAMAQ